MEASIAYDISYILERARLHGLPARFIASQGKTREDFDGEVVRAFEDVGGVDLILLIGFMRIVSARMINVYPARILNVHPSLLPEVSWVFCGFILLSRLCSLLAAWT